MAKDNKLFKLLSTKTPWKYHFYVRHLVTYVERNQAGKLSVQFTVLFITFLREVCITCRYREGELDW